MSVYVDILTTPLGTRVMLPEYGSKLFDLVDNPTDPSLAMRIIMESAGAIARWEPRVRIDRINVLAVDIGKNNNINYRNRYRNTTAIRV